MGQYQRRTGTSAPSRSGNRCTSPAKSNVASRLSKLKLETALKALEDYKLVQLSGDILERGDGVEGVGDLHALEPKLTGFLR